MNEIDNNNIKSILYDLSKKIILPNFKNLKEQDIMRKNNNDLVTKVDILVEESLNQILCDLLPGSNFVGEEKFTNSPEILNHYLSKKYCWTVDPIDGTTNYVNGKEKFAVMIALSYEKQILQSWIYKPLTNEIYSSKLGDGSYFEDNKIYISNNFSINNSVGSISSKYWNDTYIDKLKKIKFKFKDVNSYGCIAYEYIDILIEKRQFAILSKLSPWDHLPGILILREAGGFDSYFDNGLYKHYLNKNNMVVANNSKLGNKILSLIKE